MRKPIRPRAGTQVVHAHPAGAVVDHLLHAALAQGEHLGDRRRRSPRARRWSCAPSARGRVPSISRRDDAAACRRCSSKPSRRIVSTSTAELQLAATLDLPGVRTLGVQDADRHVADQLLVKARLDLAGRQLVAVLAGERRVLTCRSSRRSTARRRCRTGSGRGSSASASVSPMVISGRPATAHDLARAGLLDRHSVAGPSVTNSSVILRRVTVAPSARHQADVALADRAVGDAAERRGGRRKRSASRLVTSACRRGARGRRTAAGPSRRAGPAGA